ncbi:Ig-like domain-containing protein [Candidatus Allofournierella excrementavium]|uniref:Ig-like domain-containing protein n=1 Tax=Candidatus Allofournierella excrementavium TaxID=2838591 RepID=UPI003AB51310
MKKRTLIFLSVAAALALALCACGGAKLTSFALEGDEPMELVVGGSAALTPIFSYEGETPSEGPAVTYESADEAVATVDESGVVTGVAVGETTITATVGEMSASRAVVVNLATESLTVEEMRLHLADGAAQAVVAVEPAELAGQLTFKTGDEAIATVDEAGNVTPVKEGHTSLLVLAPDGTRAKAMVTVWSGPKELTLTAEKTQVTKGGTVAVTAADETGAAVDAATLTWSSSDETVATVDETGTVKMVGVGEATITAETAWEVAGSVTLTGKAAAKAPANNTGSTAAPAGGQGGAAAQPSQPAQPEPAPQPQPQPEPAPQPQPENPSGGHVHDSPTVDLDPDAGFDAGDLT